LDTEPSSDPIVHLTQLRTLKATYDSLLPNEPWLPSADSPLPALLALRNTDKVIRENAECKTILESGLEAITNRREKEKADLLDAKLIREAMEARIASLKETIEAQSQRTPAQIARELIREVKRKKGHYDKETNVLLTSFKEFINTHLAVMLAAEQLGGPVAGQNPSIDGATLEGGFSTQGKARKAPAKSDEDTRQRRLDQVWGIQFQQEADRGDWDEKDAAAADMMNLTEQLLNNLVEAEGKGPGTYVQLEQDSAAARFLVRAKVAQFHPTNGMKIRLFDFGGELDD